MLPFFFQHYDKIVDRYFVYDNGSTDGSLALLENHGHVEISHFDVTGDSFVEEECHLGNTIWRNSSADWVIITDIDEHIYHPDLPAYLRRCTARGITAIQSIGFEMVSDRFPRGNRPLVEQVTTGTRSIGHNRLCIFNPKEIRATNFAPGRHQAAPEGHVVWPTSPEVLLLHYKQLGTSYLIARSAELRRGLRQGDLEKAWGLHYTWSPDEIVTRWQGIRELSGPVPGLGKLKHIKPAKYLEDDRIVEKSGLFDDQWYLATYPDVNDVGYPAFAHYCNHGWNEGRQPNFYFDPDWYLTNYPKFTTPGRNPLCGYVLGGERRGASPSPRFDTRWYRAQHGLSADESPLRHYLARRTSGLVSPLREFDVVDHCARYPEVITLGKDPFEDYCKRQN
jgi:hypothetical protein